MLLGALASLSAGGSNQVTIVDPPKGIEFRDPERIAKWGYPDDALRQNVSGTVEARLGLDKNGDVVRCDVTRSSGHQSLDEGTCYMWAYDQSVVATAGAKIPFTIDVRVVWTVPAMDDPDRARVDKSVFTAEDYPRDAMEEDAQGVTGVNLTLDKRGKVKACSIRESSGHPSLDAKTCEVFIERGQATMLGSNAPLPQSTEARVRWVLPGGVFFGNTVQQRSVRGGTKDGEPVCTNVTYGQSEQLDPEECMEMFAIAALLQNSTEPLDSGEATFEQGLVMGNDLAGVESRMVGKILMRGAVRLSVAETGRVETCEVIKPTEWKRAANVVDPPDGCKEVKRMRFERSDERPSDDKSKADGPAETVREGIMYWFITFTDRVTDG